MYVILGILYILSFLSLRVMPIVPSALHLLVLHDDDITRQLANCDENYKFFIYPYSMLQEFAVDNEVDNEVIVTSHPEIVRKLHT